MWAALLTQGERLSFKLHKKRKENYKDHFQYKIYFQEVFLNVVSIHVNDNLESQIIAAHFKAPSGPHVARGLDVP